MYEGRKIPWANLEESIMYKKMDTEEEKILTVSSSKVC